MTKKEAVGLAATLADMADTVLDFLYGCFECADKLLDGISSAILEFEAEVDKERIRRRLADKQEGDTE